MSAFRHGEIGHDRPRYRFRNLPGGRNLSSLWLVKFVWRAVVASLLAVLFLTTVAEAGGGTVQNVETHSKIKVSDKSISPGDDLFIVGRLKSDKNACRVNMVLKLFFKGNQVGSKSTNNNGKVFFKKNPYSTGKWQIRFEGKKSGTHPNKLFCKPSRSNADQGQGQLTFR